MSTQANALAVLLMALLDVNATEERPAEDPYKGLKEAVAAGKNVQVKIMPYGKWYDSSKGQYDWSLPVECYRIDPLQDIKDAFKAGKVIEHRLDDYSLWKELSTYAFDSPPHRYRIRPEPVDPYAELKKAHAEGKAIQLCCLGRWLDICPDWTASVGRYRIKPEVYKFQAVKDAYDAGQAIEFRSKSGEWKDAKYPTWAPGFRYRIKLDPYKEFREALARGEELEIENDGNWALCAFKPNFNLEPDRYRIYDEHREVKEAHAAGKQIQFENLEGYYCWVDCNKKPEWRKGIKYRVKPEVIRVRYRRALAKSVDGTFRIVASDISTCSFKTMSSCADFVKWIDGENGISETVVL